MAASVDPSHYVIEYAKNSSEKCNGKPPCSGSMIVLGDLRFGTKKYNGTINEKMQYRHWGCVTPDILYDLAILGVNRLPGLNRLNAADQGKIHTAARCLHVDDADIPVTARSLTRTASVPSGSQPPRIGAAPPFSQRAAATTSQIMAPLAGTSKKRKAPTRSKAKAAPAPVPAALPSLPAAMPPPVHTQPPRLAPAQPPPRLPHMDTQITMSQQKRDDEDYVDEDFGAEEEAQYTDFYLSFQSSVVGIQYYDGLVGPGEQVALVREPGNRYDRNAIQVMNIGMRQVGHIPRQVAANLAPLIDRELILVEGTMNDGNLQGAQYTLNVTLNIYGKPGVRTMLEPLLRWATPGKRGFTEEMRRQSGVAYAQTASYSAGASQGPSYGSGSAHNPMYTEGSSSQPQLSQKAMEALEVRRRAEELRTMLAGLEKVDDEGRRANFLDALYANQAEDILNLPEHTSPPGKEDGTLVVDLLKHQKQGLLWCINRENVVLPTKHGEPHQQFWEYRAPPGSRAHYMNLITKSPIPASMAPAIGHGGIMSDSMGLGKSLTFLALVIATRNSRPEGFDKPTLIVCPLSVLSNWETQIDDHCNPGALACYTYYGNNRNVDPEILKDYDIVLTTYQTVSSDFDRAGGLKTTEELMTESLEDKKRSKGLFAIQWKRVVLDEAHQIRNPKTKIAQATTAIDGYYRWAVSGTPIVNSPTDLGSLLAFLRMCSPLDQIAQFNRSLARPLQKGNPESMALLREIMRHISIRRSKEMQNAEGKRLVELPQVMIHVTKVDLDDATRRIYESVEALSRQRFMEMANASQDGERVPNVVLSLLTRMRQIALHPGLVPYDYLQQLQSGEKYGGNDLLPSITVSPQEKVRLQNILFRAEEDSEECAICFDSLKNPRILPDGHYFCYDCIAGYIEAHGALATCPMDRRPITMRDLIEPPPPTDLTQASREDNIKGLSDGSSAKVDQLIWLLKRIPSQEKAVVFSQFTSFLDKIADQLEAHGISYVEFNGGLSAKRRQEVLQRFSRPLPVKNSAIRRTSGSKNTKGSDSDSDYAPGDDDFIDDDDGNYFTTTQSNKGKGRAGATGLNLTVANHLFLMDPWWQEAIESQAIDRVNRIGQKRDVHVYQMITNDTMEAKVLDIQARKKVMIDQAFSGMGGHEAIREKRETRMQEFIELFGLQRQNGRVTLGKEAAAAQAAEEEEEPDWLPTGPIKRSRLILSDDE
ncbi:unnamed protein product [Rhizoctonia solani]|uniref:Uncharacterized protein n=1 Tax=Rhizoctonia solani TaxID=456999 RepID=A0A8H2ZU52_9AGAM|nr:unnamed protein product [Rhizoctonia solani]